MVGGVKNLQSKKELDSMIRDGAPFILHFWASWCGASKQMDQVFSHLCTDFPHAHFLRVEAEELPEVSEAYSVSAVPYFVFIKDGKCVDTLEGANPSGLANKVAKIAGLISAGDPAAPASLGMAAGPAVLETIKDLSRDNGSSEISISTQAAPPTPNNSLVTRLKRLVESHPVMLFMKGTPEEPQCGFSRKVVDVLKEEDVKFGSFDILSDSEVRSGLKEFSNWPTFPQLFCGGELIGGCDIVVSLHESGELKSVFSDNGVGTLEQESRNPDKSTDPTSRLENLVNSNPVMVFMKGDPNEPKCGYSRKMIEILQQEKAEFSSFDVLSDDEVRRGLKAYSSRSSYPQLYVRGEFVGGSDIVSEMHKCGELKNLLIGKGVFTKAPLEERLRELVNLSPAMLFMKGDPDSPRCGFSSKAVDALRDDDVEFGSFDVLSDDEVRQGLKAFSQWPTFPQLYYKGELVGGCDIILELHNNGELKSTLSE